MSAEIPSIEPTSITAGNTLAWKAAIDDYSAADSWVLKYYLRGPSAIDITATQDGSTAGFSIVKTAAETAAYIAGDYLWQAYVSKVATSERYLVGEGSIKILPNWETINGTIETRSQAKRTFDELNNAIEALAGRLEASYSIGGGISRTVTRHDLPDLMEWRDYWSAIVAREEAAAAAALGEGTGKNILVRFGAP